MPGGMEYREGWGVQYRAGGDSRRDGKTREYKSRGSKEGVEFGAQRGMRFRACGEMQ